eukprot:scaffold1330_cov240-Pinguiococcus_pyrenoidosus.AAC.10
MSNPWPILSSGSSATSCVALRSYATETRTLLGFKREMAGNSLEPARHASPGTQLRRETHAQAEGGNQDREQHNASHASLRSSPPPRSLNAR